MQSGDCTNYRETQFGQIDGCHRHLGRYVTAEEAARGYDRAAQDAFGEFACTKRGLGTVAPIPRVVERDIASGLGCYFFVARPRSSPSK
jgi:hypothetical protein